MKTFASFLLGVLLVCVALPAQAGPKPSVRTVNEPVLKKLPLSSCDDLHVLRVYPPDTGLRWVTWGTSRNRNGNINVKMSMAVKLALLKKSGKGSVLICSVERKDAYNPKIKWIYSWRYGKYPVLAFTYLYGALAEEIELYGLDSNDQPVLLGQESGETVQWSIGSNGEVLLGLYTKPEGRPMPTWYRWQAQTNTLERTTNSSE